MAQRLAIMFASLLAVLDASCAAKPPTQDAFIADMKQRLETQSPGARLTPIDGDPLSLHFAGAPDIEEATVNLHRIFGFCQTAEAADCEKVKNEFARKITLRPATATAESLRLIVRDAEYLDYLRQTGQKAKKQPFAIYEQIGDDLYAILASDSPETITLVGAPDLEKLGLSRERAWKRAWEQTRKILPALPSSAQLRAGAVVFEDHEYGGTLLADKTGWDSFAGQAGPDMFVTAVADRFIFIGSMPDGPDLDKFAETVADDCKHQERCISPHIYRFRKGRWIIAR